MNENKKTVFLSTPAGMFKSIEETKNCARSLRAFLDYMFKKNGICENSVMIGISNINGKKAHYTSTPRAKEAGVDEYCLKLIVGHQIGDVTERVYTHRTIESLAAEIEKIG